VKKEEESETSSKRTSKILPSSISCITKKRRFDVE
jgi:hypothetical protein